jgi:hypothetical protein
LEVFVIRFTTFLLTLCLVGCTTGASYKPTEEPAEARMSLEDACATVYTDCRKNHTIRLRTEDGSTKETHFEISYPPVQNEEVVTVFPGETILIGGDWEEGRLTKIRTVPSSEDPNHVLTFKFEQLEGKVDMSLAVSNTTKKMLKYRLGMQVLDRDGVFKTSSCPVIPGGHAYEHWPHPIFQLVVMDIESIPEGGPMRCE